HSALKEQTPRSSYRKARADYFANKRSSLASGLGDDRSTTQNGVSLQIRAIISTMSPSRRRLRQRLRWRQIASLRGIVTGRSRTFSKRIIFLQFRFTEGSGYSISTASRSQSIERSSYCTASVQSR